VVHVVLLRLRAPLDVAFEEYSILMSVKRQSARAAVGLGAAALLAMSIAAPAAAHETRIVGDYRVTVGMIAEPVYVGQKSGLEFRVVTDNEDEALREPVEGLAEDGGTITATVTKSGVTQDAEIAARFGSPGWYQSYFFPTEAGPYEFQLTGTIEGTPIDESWTAGSPGSDATGQFGAVEEVSSGQFPDQLPSDQEVADQAAMGETASGQIPIAIGLGVAGLAVGVIALIIALAGRRRSA
jgi:hypothetical protein